ncbi:MAG: UDP-N-acetylmuramoyl-L-alanyl-D-glutamate--2,6-diaminopimelate ligase [Proteobacteria bacterium]|nr:UDP-N-acetylmuramoyl-L-alanyl-D-glutamate--2,6-diaminopimelate ligase [Pseudomonadota bacterium]
MNFRLASLLQGIVRQKVEGEVSGLAQDSRNIGHGMLFLAVPGRQVDGRKYISSAIKAGAVAVVYDPTGYLLKDFGVPCYPVPDLYKYIGEIANRFYGEPSTALKVIGVTGTNGKTTVAMLLTQALTRLKCSAAYLGTLGAVQGDVIRSTGYTTPDSISLQKQLAEWRDSAVKIVCLEVSSHALDQGRVIGTKFEGAILTNLTHDHLDYHQTMARYAEAKSRLFCDFTPNWSVLNVDDAFGLQLANKASVKNSNTYGETADISASDVKQGIDGLSFTIVDHGKYIKVATRLVGAINVPNILAVYSALTALGYSELAIVDAIASLTSVPGRMELFANAGAPRVVVDYAHTPDALERALVSLRDHCEGLLWCVFGCGGDRDVEKRPIMGAIAEKLADEVLLTNDNPRSESPESIVRDIRSGMKLTPKVRLDRADAIAYAITEASDRDWVLVAGKGHETQQILKDSQLEFSDRQFVREMLEAA